MHLTLHRRNRKACYCYDETMMHSHYEHAEVNRQNIKLYLPTKTKELTRSSQHALNISHHILQYTFCDIGPFINKSKYTHRSMIDSPSPLWFVASRLAMSKLTSNRCGAEDLYVIIVRRSHVRGWRLVCCRGGGGGGWIGYSGRWRWSAEITITSRRGVGCSSRLVWRHSDKEMMQPAAWWPRRSCWLVSEAPAAAAAVAVLLQRG